MITPVGLLIICITVVTCVSIIMNNLVTIFRYKYHRRHFVEKTKDEKAEEKENDTSLKITRGVLVGSKEWMEDE